MTAVAPFSILALALSVVLAGVGVPYGRLLPLMLVFWLAGPLLILYQRTAAEIRRVQ